MQYCTHRVRNPQQKIWIDWSIDLDPESLWWKWNKWNSCLFMKAKSTQSLCQRIMNWLYSSEWDLMLAVLAHVLPNFVSQTKQTLLHTIILHCALRRLDFIYLFFQVSLMWLNLSTPWSLTEMFQHNSKAIIRYNTEMTLLTVHQQWIHWNSIWVQWSEACVDCAAPSCLPQWVCLAPGTSVCLMSGTPASGCPGTLPPPGLMDTSLSTSLRVWTFCYGYKTVLVMENICVLMVSLHQVYIFKIRHTWRPFHVHVSFQALMSPWRCSLEMWPPTNCTTWNLEPPMTWRCWHSTTQASVHLWLDKAPHVS